LRHAEKRELPEALRLDDGLKIIDARLERRTRRGSIGQAAAPLVIANESVVSRQFREPVSPYRTARIVLGMAEPVRGSQKRWSAAQGCHCDPCTVARFAKSDVLLEPHDVPDVDTKRRVRCEKSATYPSAAGDLTLSPHHRIGNMECRQAPSEAGTFIQLLRLRETAAGAERQHPTLQEWAVGRSVMPPVYFGEWAGSR
jgi:hypothetical protein